MLGVDGCRWLQLMAVAKCMSNFVSLTVSVTVCCQAVLSGRIRNTADCNHSWQCMSNCCSNYKSGFLEGIWGLAINELNLRGKPWSQWNSNVINSFFVLTLRQLFWFVPRVKAVDDSKAHLYWYRSVAATVAAADDDDGGDYDVAGAGEHCPPFG